MACGDIRRPSVARTIDFIITWCFVAFIGIHVVMVVVSGFINNVRSMVTGWYFRKSGAMLKGNS